MRTLSRGLPTRMARPAHVVWDWNGTLLDDTQACLNAINVLLREHRLKTIDHATYRAGFGFPVRDFYRALGLRPDSGNWNAMAARFHELYLAQPATVTDAARAAVAGIAAAGLPQSVLSACEQRILELLIARHGLSGCFQHIQGTDNLDGHSKLAVGRELVARLRLAPAQLLLIGDTVHDAEVAAELGCPCLLVANGHQSRERLERTGRPVISSLADLPEAFDTNVSYSHHQQQETR
ncbi:MAG: HAD hydrolase-like protein [Kiritimatiellae bacterium]|nr:HAD hydrolase-like protein [Kiritimatiellia bacterium]